MFTYCRCSVAAMPVCGVRRAAAVAAAATALAASSWSAAAAPREALQPRPERIKPADVALADHHDPSVIHVKFRDDLTVQVVDGRLSDADTGDLNAALPTLQALGDGRWQRAYGDVPVQRLRQLREVAQARTARAMPDLSLQMVYHPPAGADARAVLNALNALEVVELALPGLDPPPPPLPPSFQPNQAYADAATDGISAEDVWAAFGVRGEGVRLVDVEYDWNHSHLDLPDLTALTADPIGPFGDGHGTAVMGVIVGLDNGWGVTGLAPDVDPYVADPLATGTYNVGAAIISAANALDPGDIILIEQQTNGPVGQYVPVEWWPFYYDTIVTAVGSGITVIEAAGNGSQNLDAPIYSTGNFGHWPFLPENDSGAIIVGAGAAAPGFGSDVDRSRLDFSNYGSTVDLQGWGEGVWTCGYGDAWFFEGVNLFYTAQFAGTSSASPVVAAAAALLQSAYKSANDGEVLSPEQVKQRLQATGSPQTNGTFPASQNIGPRPDAFAAIHNFAAEPAPVNDLCIDATLITSTDPLAFANASATSVGPSVSGCSTPGEAIHHDVWFTYFPPCAGSVTVSVCDADFDTALAVYEGACPAADATPVACNNDACGEQSSVTFEAPQPFAQYRIRIGSAAADEVGEGMLTVTCTPVTTCPADLDASKAVDVTDLLQLLSAWGACADCAEDLTEDKSVAVDDLLDLLGAWGPCTD